MVAMAVFRLKAILGVAFILSNIAGASGDSNDRSFVKYSFYKKFNIFFIHPNLLQLMAYYFLSMT